MFFALPWMVLLFADWLREQAWEEHKLMQIFRKSALAASLVASALLTSEATQASLIGDVVNLAAPPIVSQIPSPISRTVTEGAGPEFSAGAFGAGLSAWELDIEAESIQLTLIAGSSGPSSYAALFRLTDLDWLDSSGATIDGEITGVSAQRNGVDLTVRNFDANSTTYLLTIDANTAPLLRVIYDVDLVSIEFVNSQYFFDTDTVFDFALDVSHSTGGGGSPPGTPVPEPGTAFLALAGLAALRARRGSGPS